MAWRKIIGNSFWIKLFLVYYKSFPFKLSVFMFDFSYIAAISLDSLQLFLKINANDLSSRGF